MIIRQSQIEVFEDASVPAFEDQMVMHLKEFSPIHSEMLGEDGVRPIIQSGINRAKEYKWSKRGPVQFFIDMVFLLGVEFDTDPQYPWASHFLLESTLDNQVERADEMHGEVMAYLEATGGPRREFALCALRKARQMPYEGPRVSSSTYHAEALQRAREAYPEKFDYLGEPLVRKVVDAGLKEAQRYSVTSDAGVSLITSLMFALGHGVLRDPKYPFMESTLMNTAIPEPNRRAERLYSKTMVYLDRVLQRRG